MSTQPRNELAAYWKLCEAAKVQTLHSVGAEVLYTVNIPKHVSNYYCNV